MNELFFLFISTRLRRHSNRHSKNVSTRESTSQRTRPNRWWNLCRSNWTASKRAFGLKRLKSSAQWLHLANFENNHF